jgi:orotidine-5'-phosphate decarboxylase
MGRFISSKKSVIVAADVQSLGDLSQLASALVDVPGIGGFKIGCTVGLRGLREAAQIVKDFLGPKFPIIYDHQKAGNDIPEMGAQFAKVIKESGVDTVILFPFTGPIAQDAWTRACFDANLHVVTGGIMTHAKFLVSEGGYVADESVERIYRTACDRGCTHFVVPGTKIDWVKRICGWLVNDLGHGNFVLYAPGFITQGGDISECGQVAGDEWHAIVGSAIYGQKTEWKRREAAIAVTRQIAAVSA